MLPSLKMECYHFWLPVTVGQEPRPGCYFEEETADFVKAFFFTHLKTFFFITRATSEEEPQERAHALRVWVTQFVLAATVSMVFKAEVYFSS